MSDGGRRRYLREAGLRSFTSRTLTDVDALVADLRTGAQAGVFTEVEQYRQGVGCVATLIRRDVDDGCWAVGVSHGVGQVERVRAQLVRPLRVAATDLAAA